jgi:hypothetical protein
LFTPIILSPSTLGPSSSGGHGNLWFSFNVGPIHFASVSSEHNYSTGSPQALWLDADLAAVDRSVTPWVILSLHRPVYSADASEYDSHSPGGALARWLEPVGRAHKVRAVGVCVHATKSLAQPW